ncbi:MAG: HlyD family efflux transporter periplasmic adaptor subunit [Acidobacteriota bacterium]|nr:MAG: HlyD family efflux transporter periplasmic adaptor subunit [Acidobacteriota bacterium]
MDPMDRSIDPTVRRWRRIRRLIVPSAAIAAALVILVLAIGWLRPSVRRDRVRTAKVERGDVSATLDASGLVVPGFEQILTAPLATRIVRILETQGAEVQAGEPIVLLDDRDAHRDVARLEEQIALKRNAQRQTRLELDRTRNELKAKRAVKALELESYRYELKRNHEMFGEGLTHEDSVRRSETDVARASIELEHVDALLASAEEDLAARAEQLALEISILEKDLERARERLASTSVTAERAGIVTWVVANEGAAVAEGEPVARVADLSTYRVDATVSDVLARRLTIGLPAVVRSGDTRLTGRVQKILPTVQNGIVTFEVHLDEPGHAILRPNLRVDVHAVTQQRTGALCLRRGPLLNFDGRDCVFVVRGDRAVRTPVTIGLSNFELYEITDGLAEGDEVIISDMSDYRNAKEVMLR